MKKDRRRIKPTLDLLEDRRLLSTYGNAWPSGNISLSFVPDGTQDGLAASKLAQDLAPLNANGNDWQLQLLKAAQTWADAANININLTSDGGQAVGTPGPIQGDSRFGDIRIGAVPQSSSTLALTQPFQYAAGSTSGDVNLNANASFGINSSTSPDLYTVALHELGHSLGLDDNGTDTTSVMYDSYQGPRAGLSSGDVAAIQSLYGPRSPDKYEGASGNNTPATATSIGFDKVKKTSASTKIDADLASTADVDYYKFTPSISTGTISFQLKTAGISLMEGKVTVSDGNQVVLGSATSVDPRTGSVTVQLPGVTAGKTYYIKVQGDGVDAFGMGAYELNITTGTVDASADDSANFFGKYPVTNGFVNYNTTANTFATATSLNGLYQKHDWNFDYAMPGSLPKGGSVNDYSFTSPSKFSTGATGLMSVIVFGLDPNAVNTRITIYDANQKPVAANVVLHEGGSSIIQVPNASANTTYYASVAAYAPNGIHTTGNYFLAVQFGGTADGSTTLSTGTAFAPSGTATPTPLTITASHDDLFHFVLAASNGGTSALGSVQLTITDASGSVVSTLVVQANQEQSLAVWLAAGTYQVTVSPVAVTGTTAPAPLKWTLATEDMSDPIKVFGNSGGGGGH